MQPGRTSETASLERRAATVAASSGMTALDFASTARSLGRAARLRDLVVPDFASPPRRADLDRSIRRRAGSPLVSVRLRGRPRNAVLADMIEGVVVANRLTGARADLVRAALWLAVDGEAERSNLAAGAGSAAGVESARTSTASQPAPPTIAA